MNVIILLPLLIISAVASYVTVYRSLEIPSDSKKFYLAAFGTIILTALGILAVTGYIRPFYSAYIIMVIWIIIQRLYLVRSPNSSVWTNSVDLK